MPTRTLPALLLSATMSLLLASCGGGGPAPAAEDDAATTPVTGGTIARPANSTAAGEFIVTGVRAQSLAQALGLSGVSSAMRGDGLRALALQDEMRILLTVNRAKTGLNAGKKRASVVFVWGNQTETAQSRTVTNSSAPGGVERAFGYYVSGYPEPAAEFAYLPQYQNAGKLDMTVKSPDFQAKITRSSPYVPDSGKTCARLEIDFTTVRNDGTTAGYTPLLFNNVEAPMVVCEGTTERAAEQVALENATRALNYSAGSLVAAPFDYVSWDGQAAALTDAELRTKAGAGVGAGVTHTTLAAWAAPFKVVPTGNAATWTPAQKAQAATAKKWTNLEKQFGYYFTGLDVATVATSPSRDDLYITGRNGWGVGGLHTLVVR